MAGFAAPPKTVAMLLARAEQLAGVEVAELAATLGQTVPTETRAAKGFVGALVEKFLGATAGSRAEPDFPGLGVELKTLPVSREGRPKESTFVCTLELSQLADAEWESSRVKRKLSRVLWVPVEGDRSIELRRRQIGTPFLWTPSSAEEAVVKSDWEALVGIVGQGRTAEITGHLGQALQVRPKAQNSRSTRLAFDEEGVPYSELPRGFYLRTSFTATILAQRFARMTSPDETS